MLQKKASGFPYAIQGLKIVWRDEISFRIQLTLALIALALGWFFEISTTEWLFIAGMIGFVLSAETFNTALEELCDKFKTDLDPHIAKIKDLAAAAVLLASSTAFVIGAIIFVPYVIEFLS